MTIHPRPLVLVTRNRDLLAVIHAPDVKTATEFANEISRRGVVAVGRDVVAEIAAAPVWSASYSSSAILLLTDTRPLRWDGVRRLGIGHVILLPLELDWLLDRLEFSVPLVRNTP